MDATVEPVRRVPEHDMQREIEREDKRV